MNGQPDTSGRDALEGVDLTPGESYRPVNPVRYAVTALLFELCNCLPPRATASLSRAFGAGIRERARDRPTLRSTGTSSPAGPSAASR